MWVNASKQIGSEKIYDDEQEGEFEVDGSDNVENLKKSKKEEIEK